MDDPVLQRMRIYLHLLPVFGVIPSLWTLYTRKSDSARDADIKANTENPDMRRLQSASQLSVLMGIGSVSAIALFGAMASTQPTQLAAFRFLIGASFIGSGYFLLSLVLMFRVASGQSIRLPVLTSLSRRLP